MPKMKQDCPSDSFAFEEAFGSFDAQTLKEFEKYILAMNKAFIKYGVRENIQDFYDKRGYKGLFQEKVLPEEYAMFRRKVQDDVDIVISSLKMDPEVIKFTNLVKKEFNNISLYEQILDIIWVWLLNTRKFITGLLKD